MLALPEDAATIDWFKGVRFEDKEKNWRASLKAASVRLFLRGDREGLPGWVDASYAGLVHCTGFGVTVSDRCWVHRWDILSHCNYDDAKEGAWINLQRETSKEIEIL